ncbi:hypothetical protein [Nonomuraea sp. B1E8]|uniref:hypothetical protein n=1 Tax=unclassified Nonomuraea TaxID=2593643 RepID=UPI00325D8D8C
MHRLRALGLLAVSAALAGGVTAAPAGAAAQSSSAASCSTTSNKTGKYGVVTLKCTTTWKFQVSTWCYKENDTDSDRTRMYGGLAQAPRQLSSAVCRGSYPYRLSTGFSYDVLG